MYATFFGLGPWASFFYAGKLPDEHESILWKAYEGVALFMLGAVLMYKFMAMNSRTRTANTLWDTISAAQRISALPILLVFIATWILRITVALNYGILFSGTQTEEHIREIPYYITVTQTLFELLSTGCLIWAAVHIWQKQQLPSRALALCVILFSLGWALTQGRRQILICTIIPFFTYCISRSRIRLRHVAIGVCVFVFLASYVFPTFLRLRIAHDHAGQQENALTEMYETIQGALDVGDIELKAYAADNMSDRPLIIRFICRILQSEERIQAMRGEAAVSTMIWIVPSVIYSEKRNTLQTEQLIQEHYCMKLEDTSITWPAVGIADFGVFGGLLAGFFFALVIYLIDWWGSILKNVHPLIAISTAGALIMTVCMVDDDPVYVLSVARSVAILCVITKALNLIGIFIPFSRFNAVDEENPAEST